MTLGTKTSSETAASALGETELFRGVQGGANVKVTADQIKTFTHQGNLPFPSTQVPSADPNTLDDYEEGTFTVAIGDGTNNYTISSQDCVYTKNGRVVTGRIIVNWSSIGSPGASQLRVGAVPFTGAANGHPVWIGPFNGLDLTATLNQITAQLAGASTSIFFERVADNAAATALPANGSSAAGGLLVGFAYHV